MAFVGSTCNNCFEEGVSVTKKAGLYTKKLKQVEGLMVCVQCEVEWYANHCYACNATIDSRNPGHDQCPDCNWYKCPSCGACYPEECTPFEREEPPPHTDDNAPPYRERVYSFIKT